MPLPKRKEFIETSQADVDDGFDYSIPTVREVREQYVVDGRFDAFYLALDRAIKEYGIKDGDYRWKQVGNSEQSIYQQFVGWIAPRVTPDFKRLGEK